MKTKLKSHDDHHVEIYERKNGIKLLQIIALGFEQLRNTCYITKHTLLLIFFLSIYKQTVAQDVKLQQITPKSPNIANFEKFTDVPVGLSTGTVNLSVPIYEIEVGGLKIPITLSYNNNGLKCDEIPSWVGLGWSLSTGGYLSYQQHGLNDFDPQRGLFPNGLFELNRYFGNQMSDLTKRNYFEAIIHEQIDSEHDEYHYNFPGNNGSFHFIDATTARTNPKADIQVLKTAQGFKIIDDRGNTFFFESKEAITSFDQESIENQFSDNSAFYITKIITVDNRTVNFTYKNYSLQYTNTSMSLNYALANCIEYGGPNWSNIRTTINYLLPDEITFPLGVVKFNHSTEIRSDLQQIDPNTTAKYLKGISVYSLNEKIKEFSFNMSYFGSGNRLKLNSVAEINENNEVLKHWEFDYNLASDGNYPAIFSKSKDHWGYYNGKTSSNTLPRANYSSLITNYNNSIVPDAVRTSDFNFAKIGTIKSVRYPTGGKTDFQYEANQFVFENYNDFQFGPFLEPPGNSDYSQLIAGGNATSANNLTGTFTIPSGGAFYKLNSWKILSPDPFYNGPEIIFSGSNSPTVDLLNSKMNQCNFNLNQCTFSDVIFLGAGTYSYVIQGSYYQNSQGDIYYLYAGFDLLGNELSNIKSYPVGGGRILKISSYASIFEEPLIKKYIYNDSLQHVSLKNIPNYLSKKDLQKVGSAAGGGTSPFCTQCGDLFTVWEQSVKPMIGSPIEYGLIKELINNQGEIGYSEKYLNFSENLGALNTPPIVAPINTSWSAGTLIKENIYEKNISVPKVKNSINYYTEYLSSQLHGIRVGYDTFCNGAPESTTYAVNPTTVYSAVFKQSSMIKKTQESLDTITTRETYFYDIVRHQNPLSISRSSSDGYVTTSKIKYSFDYDNLTIAVDNMALGLKNLKANHINTPVEELSVKKINNIDYVVGGTLRVFKSNQPVADEFYILDLSQPILLSSFIGSFINDSGSFVMDSRYILKVKFDSYDPQNHNLLEQHIQNGAKTCYVWSYNNQYPVIEIANVDYSTILFVLGGAGNIANFGNSNPTNSQLNDFVNTLKNSPLLKNAQITSYTYKPLVGMTSQTDAKGMTTTYEYDAFQRLMNIKDQNGNILKHTDYHYQN